MGLKDVRTELAKLDRHQLIGMIAELYRKHKVVRDFLEFYLKPDEAKLLDEYKKKVREGFFPKRGMDLKLSIARQAMNEFKKYEPSAESLADLMLYYVECGVEFINEFGDINESFYLSSDKTFLGALKLLDDSNALGKFKTRIDKLLKSARGTGWGLYDSLYDYYLEFYEE